MKKMYKLLLCAVGATMLFSCVKENFEELQGNQIPEGYEMQEFTATSLETKTTVEVNDDGTHGATLWAKGDQLSIFWNGGKGTADLEGEGGSSTGKFKGALPQGARATYAVYPSAVEASVDGNTVKVAIPAEQNGTFSAGNISVAEVGEGNALAFNNVNVFLCVQLVSGDITKITIESVAGQALVGTIPVTFGENGAECAEVENGASKVTMTKAVGETGRYYVSIVPGVTHTEGLLMTYYKGDEVTGTYQLNKQLAPVANKIYNFGEFEPDFNYYVTKDGAGEKTGLTWRDAMPFAKMVDEVFEGPAWKDEATYSCKKVLDDKYNGATFHIEEGEYEIDESWRALRYINDELVTLTFMGGYNKNTHKRDLVNCKTDFTNKHGNNVLDVDCNDAACCDMDITFDGIGFVNAEMTGKNNAAIYSYCGDGAVNLTIKNCHFTGNTHVDEVDGSNGAALMIFSLKNVVIENTLFANNKAVCAPAITIADTKATITNCTFENNEATQNAGVVYVNSGAKPTFNNCVFNGNKALKWGMVHHNSGTTTLNNCTFTNNTISDEWDGGAIATRNGSTGSISVNGGEISGNHAGWGAAVYQALENKTKVADIYLNDVLIKNNSTGGSGAIWANGKAVITRCVLDGNTAAGTGTSDATAIVVARGGNMSLYGCTVQNHKADQKNCNTIIIRDKASLYIGPDSYGNRSLIKDNSAQYGGAIRLAQSGSNTDASTLNAEATTFEGNVGQYGGAILACGPSDINLYNGVVFKDNYSSKGNGGAILFESKGTLACNRCHFENNRAKNEGGAIKVDNSSAKLYLNATTFKGNYQDGQEAGTTIQIHQINAFAMNNCTIADDTYSKRDNRDSQPRVSWMSFNEPQKIWISNSTFIGVPRYNGNPTAGGLLRMWLDVDTDAHLVNNIVVNDEQDNTWSFCQLDKSWEQGTRASVTLHHTKYAAIENPSGTGEMITYVESPTSAGFSKSSFGGLKWNDDECYWSWNGTMTGGNNKNMITRDQFVAALEDANPDFKAWLESEGELNVDQLGHDRGTGAWWPGSYQPGRVVVNANLDVAVTTFNVRGSDNDEDTGERAWSYRKAGVYAWFNENDFPFVCVQECSDDQRADILVNCTGYDVVDRKLTSSEKMAVHGLTHSFGADDYEPVKIFYKKSDVENVTSGTFWLTDTPSTPSKMSNQNQHRMAQWMKCTYKGYPMVVVATHISYTTANKEEDYSNGAEATPMQQLREYEMGVIKTWLSDVNNYNPATDGPVVLAGDFNIQQANKVFTYWRDNNDDCGWYYARDTAYNNDKDACDTGRTYNGWGSGQSTIDHQFYSGFSDVKSYLVDREPYAGVTFISDHWPLTVEYKF